MRSKKIIPALATFIMLPLLYLMVSLLSSSRPNLPMDDLPISNPSFPTAWDSGEIPVSVEKWQQVEEPGEATVVSLAPAASGRAWTNGGAVTIYVTVLRFDNPLTSYWNYMIHTPERVRFYDWPNFDYGCYGCYPRHWNNPGSHADQEHVVCAMSDENSCQVFYDWSRYGQYLVLVELFAPNQGADDRTFASMVSETDQWIYTKFSRP